MSQNDGAIEITHKGVLVHAAPYAPQGGTIEHFHILKPGSLDVLHTVEGPWESQAAAKEGVIAAVEKLIEDGKI
ncbi:MULTISPECIES: hypothetical protein [Pseudomonas]|nr:MULTISPECIES: hypothetical protein [Pseudomonas]EKT4542773.1 hypothetical protein [Pseudomonas putida]RRV19130.1 hypothetical protein EGJ22_11075 [Pseudomonas sp. p99-361]